MSSLTYSRGEHSQQQTAAKIDKRFSSGSHFFKPAFFAFTLRPKDKKRDPTHCQTILSKRHLSQSDMDVPQV